MPPQTETNTSESTDQIAATAQIEETVENKTEEEAKSTVNEEDEKNQPKQEEVEKEKVVETKVNFDPITYKEISKKAKQLTDLQFEEYAKTLVGKHIQWKGRVLEVEKKMFGGYEILIDMDKKGMFSVQDVYIPVTKEVAININKKDTIKFQGKIKSAMEILESVNIHIEDAKIL